MRLLYSLSFTLFFITEIAFCALADNACNGQGGINVDVDLDVLILGHLTDLKLKLELLVQILVKLNINIAGLLTIDLNFNPTAGL